VSEVRNQITSTEAYVNAQSSIVPLSEWCANRSVGDEWHFVQRTHGR